MTKDAENELRCTNEQRYLIKEEGSPSPGVTWPRPLPFDDVALRLSQADVDTRMWIHGNIFCTSSFLGNRHCARRWSCKCTMRWAASPDTCRRCLNVCACVWESWSCVPSVTPSSRMEASVDIPQLTHWLCVCPSRWQTGTHAALHLVQETFCLGLRVLPDLLWPHDLHRDCGYSRWTFHKFATCCVLGHHLLLSLISPYRMTTGFTFTTTPLSPFWVVQRFSLLNMFSWCLLNFWRSKDYCWARAQWRTVTSQKPLSQGTFEGCTLTWQRAGHGHVGYECQGVSFMMMDRWDICRIRPQSTCFWLCMLWTGCSLYLSYCERHTCPFCSPTKDICTVVLCLLALQPFVCLPCVCVCKHHLHVDSSHVIFR